MRPVRYGFVCNAYHRGGISRWMVALAVEGTRRGHEIWFVTPRPERPFVNGHNRPSMLSLLEAHAPAERPHIVAPRVGDEFEFGKQEYRASVYAEAVSSRVPLGVPLFVSDDPAAWQGVSWVAGRNPLIAGVHGDHPHYDGLLRAYAGSVAAVMAVSERLKQRVVGLGLPDGIPVEVVPCGVELPPRVAPRPAGTRPLRLAWVGRLDEEQKRVSDLPKIAAALCRLGCDFTLDIMGDGEAAPALGEAVAAMRLGGRVRLLGWGSPDEVQRLLAAADILVLPSNMEGWPVTVMEALALGCAVVASRVSGIEDLEHCPGARGCLRVFAVGDVEAAARSIVEMGREPAGDRVARARSLAEREFSISVNADRVERLLERVAPGRPTPRPILARHRALLATLSYPIAAQRVARLWLAGRYRRPAPATASLD